MKARIIDGRELGPGEVKRWAEIQGSDAALASPYQTPHYVRAVAAVRPGVRVAVMEEGSRTRGFFPFQDADGGAAEAVGDRISDSEAVIAEGDFEWTAAELLRACGLAAWRYRRVIPSQVQFHRYHEERFHSPRVDLSEGFEQYAAAKHAGGGRVLQKLEALRAKLEAAAGPVRYEPQCLDPAALRALMVCKSEQYRRTGKPDRFAFPWVVELLERLQATRESDFSGMLSVLWAGDRMAAAHFGMRSATVWNYWFPCYSREFAAYSPGLILLSAIVRSAESLGARIVELGAGEADYKLRFANSMRVLAKGTATAST